MHDPVQLPIDGWGLRSIESSVEESADRRKQFWWPALPKKRNPYPRTRVHAEKLIDRHPTVIFHFRRPGKGGTLKSSKNKAFAFSSRNPTNATDLFSIRAQLGGAGWCRSILFSHSPARTNNIIMIEGHQSVETFPENKNFFFSLWSGVDFQRKLTLQNPTPALSTFLCRAPQ